LRCHQRYGSGSTAGGVTGSTGGCAQRPVPGDRPPADQRGCASTVPALAGRGCRRSVMVTIADVAARAGVAASTVSRVLNNSPRVSESTRARVLAAIEVLDYRPSPLARGLSRGRSQTLGVVVPFFTHASAVERLRGVAAALEGSHYDLVLFNVESPVQRDEHLAALSRRDRADGLLLMSLPPPDGSLERLTEAGVPVVLVDA